MASQYTKVATKVSATKHPCIDKMNEALLAHKTKLKEVLSLSGAPQGIYVATERTDAKRGEGKLLLATYCPFCGRELA